VGDDAPAEDELETRAQSRYEPSESPRASFLLRVTEGPDSGAEWLLDGVEPGPVLLGQSPSCAIRLTDREVSRRHVAFDVEGQRLRITDQESTNGTFVEGVAIVDAFLSGGERVRVGVSALSVERRERADAPSRPRRSHFGRFLGQSPELQRLYPLVERLAKSEVPIVIEGETGTGKEVLAEAIHEHSRRSDGPYVVLDCTTLPPTLVESELFGHERGAFTGAMQQRRGVFEQAHGGTLFIDEIGDLELGLQPKLLRALERSEVRRIGGTQQIKVDVRVIAATRRDLDRAVQEGTFRDDLFHRLAVGRIALPPLRKRQGDVLLLAKHFWKELGAEAPLPAHLFARWEHYAWPGNVRELRNAVARQLAMGNLEPSDDGAEPGATMVDDEDALLRSEAAITRILRERLPFPVARLQLLEELQKAYVERALAEHDGSVDRAARALGIGRRYFHILRTGKRTR
jgi:DNA-binding NtrC family response regulator